MGILRVLEKRITQNNIKTQYNKLRYVYVCVLLSSHLCQTITLLGLAAEGRRNTKHHNTSKVLCSKRLSGRITLHKNTASGNPQGRFRTLAPRRNHTRPNKAPLNLKERCSLELFRHVILINGGVVLR
ncbi:hypothetical protein KSP40_PGU016322 [Platanthera guangdongensis]|uniref:Uncharacterized protein n=1 Tax=Platanthera guangdongensis TaxID=2320717 RepID=A0ABR2MSZ9_9ASPA